MQYVYAIVGGSMDDMYDFNVDDIGNRMGVCRPGNRYACYAANALNQHTCVTDYSTYPETEFFPAHDADGSQILIRTEAGIWDVAYNAVSRPVLFSGGDGVQVQFAYDHRGRCCERVESKLHTIISGGHNVSYWETVSHERYLYRGYLRIAALDMLNNAALIHAAVWDPTEPAATRPLLLQTPSGWFTYSFDQAKNVTELFDSAGGIAAAYDHGPFGEDMAASGPAAGLNPFRFSSEVWDGALGLVYYTFRPYNPLDGRFISRDPIEERGGLNLYGFVGNDPVNRWDYLGMLTNEQYKEKIIWSAETRYSATYWKVIVPFPIPMRTLYYVAFPQTLSGEAYNRREKSNVPSDGFMASHLTINKLTVYAKPKTVIEYDKNGRELYEPGIAIVPKGSSPDNKWEYPWSQGPMALNALTGMSAVGSPVFDTSPQSTIKKWSDYYLDVNSVGFYEIHRKIRTCKGDDIVLPTLTLRLLNNDLK